MNYCKPKLSKEGKVLLNLACGVKTHPEWNNIDFSLYALLARFPLLNKLLNKIGILSEERYQNLIKIDKNIIRHDLRRGIPFKDNVVDFLYCAQFIEHLDKDKLPQFIKECYRVLKNNAIFRIITPNFEFYARSYIALIEKIKTNFYDDLLWSEYENLLNGVFEQMVRKESYGTSKQKLIVRQIEKIIKGNAEKAGEIHKWLYDFFSVRLLLERIGFRQVVKMSPQESHFSLFQKYSLEIEYLNEDVERNLFIEAIK